MTMDCKVDAPIHSYVLALAHTQLLVIQKRLLLHRASQRRGGRWVC